MRFTLCKLFLGVTMAALASAGMTLHTRLWAEAIVSFSILLFIAVAILAFRGAGQARAFHIAFAAVGGGYVLLVLCNTFTPIRDLLVTNRVLFIAGNALQASQSSSANTYTGTSFITTIMPNGTQTVTPSTASPYSGAVALSGNTTFTLGNVSFDWNETFGFGQPLPSTQTPAVAFLVIGHCVWSWLLALAAGCFAAFVARPRSLASS